MKDCSTIVVQRKGSTCPQKATLCMFQDGIGGWLARLTSSAGTGKLHPQAQPQRGDGFKRGWDTRESARRLVNNRRRPRVMDYFEVEDTFMLSRSRIASLGSEHSLNMK